jgi:rare lipoprotein A
MNQQLWSGLATAALIITSVGVAPSGYADQPNATDEASEASVSAGEVIPTQIASDLEAQANSTPSNEVVKVGEYQSQEAAETPEEQVAVIQPHEISGRQAATLYVRNIPVLTFLSSEAADAPSQRSANNQNSANSTAADSDIKVSTSHHSASTEEPTFRQASTVSPDAPDQAQSTDPVWQATSIAARINQLHHDSVDPGSITASWDNERQRYLIKVGEDELVEMGSQVRLPDTTEDPASDVLQATNRLRRQMGGAPPIREIEGRPEATAHQVSVGPIEFTVTGLASWYGPGFNGRRSASGEVFNQNAMTAAHRSLPFGTQVRVTNLRNGQSVVVRINDRGPFAHNRIIDLSAGAARAVGLMQAGVGPVSVDVLGTTSNSASN